MSFSVISILRTIRQSDRSDWWTLHYKVSMHWVTNTKVTSRAASSQLKIYVFITTNCVGTTTSTAERELALWWILCPAFWPDLKQIIFGCQHKTIRGMHTLSLQQYESRFYSWVTLIERVAILYLVTLWQWWGLMGGGRTDQWYTSYEYKMCSS